VPLILNTRNVSSNPAIYLKGGNNFERGILKVALAVSQFEVDHDLRINLAYSDTWKLKCEQSLRLKNKF